MVWVAYLHVGTPKLIDTFFPFTFMAWTLYICNNPLWSQFVKIRNLDLLVTTLFLDNSFLSNPQTESGHGSWLLNLLATSV